MPSSDEYRKEILQNLAKGNVDSLGDPETTSRTEYASFDDFANRSSRDERRSLFERAFHPQNIPTSQMEPELREAISKIKPNERDDVAREFFKHLEERGLSDRDLESRLGLSTRHPRRMKESDVAKLASFVYESHPDIFKEVLADKPALIKFLSNPLVGAALGVIASKWLKR